MRKRQRVATHNVSDENSSLNGYLPLHRPHVYQERKALDAENDIPKPQRDRTKPTVCPSVMLIKSARRTSHSRKLQIEKAKFLHF